VAGNTSLWKQRGRSCLGNGDRPINVTPLAFLGLYHAISRPRSQVARASLIAIERIASRPKNVAYHPSSGGGTTTMG
jgi:hypothetical protein